MQTIKLNAEDWQTALDVAAAFKSVLGSPTWHGNGIDAFIDSMTSDDINSLKPPFRIEISRLDKAKIGAQQFTRSVAEAIEERQHKGSDLEVRIQIKD